MGNVFSNGNHMLDSLLHWHQNTSSCSQAVGSVLVPASGATQCRYDYISHAIGLGVRYKTPFGPGRFYLGYNLNPTVYPNFCVKTTSTPTSPPTYTFLATKQPNHLTLYLTISPTFC